MPGQAARILISERQQQILRELRRSKSECPMVIQRAAVILLAFERRLNEDIAEEVGLNRKQVGVWQAAWDSLSV